MFLYIGVGLCPPRLWIQCKSLLKGYMIYFLSIRKDTLFYEYGCLSAIAC